jgi:type IV pilus assembly protein PilA
MRNGRGGLRRAHGGRHVGTDPGAAADAGFTLIELMVVLLVMAILIAIAIPTFLGLTSSAKDRAAQTDATNAVHEAVATWSNNNQTFTNASFASTAPEFTWSNDSSGSGVNLVNAATNTVSYWVGDAAATGDGDALILATYSKGSGRCWYAAELEANPAGSIAGDSGNVFDWASGVNEGGTYYASSTGSDCQASLADPPYNWGTSWTKAPANTVATTTTTAATTTTTTVSCSGSNPCIASVSPSTGTHNGGTTVVISGINFSSQGGCPPACSSWVQVNGAFASIQSWTATSITIVTPSGTAGAATISLSTHLGAGTSNSTLFSYS